MGLGKTLQTLGVIPRNTLIIAPTSVLGSWYDQCRKFRPELAICLYHGPQRKFNEQADLLITSFTLVRSDRELLEREWDALVIDEAHTLKNSQSLTFHSVQSLKSKWRISLTGTPIENSLQDLWSQFSLLNPGLLPPFDSFRAWPLERIRSVTRPFILRRTKEQVAQDLPPKTEIILRCTLSEEERATYDAVLFAAQRDLITEEGTRLSALKILEALLRLRQACCHPGLIADNYLQSPSAKIELLMELLGSSLEAGHPSLIFSQWVGLLNIVEMQLKTKRIPFTRLDGSTSNRQAVVNEFQDPAGPPVMLISLKAGGVGLTLTRAEHVYLLDPWWNPAVEEQAADRAHRIGQTNPVFVYKLIAENTIEEQVLELQERKLALANQILATEPETIQGTTSQVGTKWSLDEMRALLGIAGT
jgi:SNF2 family DNA or RNA helicase